VFFPACFLELPFFAVPDSFLPAQRHMIYFQLQAYSYLSGLHEYTNLPDEFPGFFEPFAYWDFRHGNLHSSTPSWVHLVRIGNQFIREGINLIFMKIFIAIEIIVTLAALLLDIN
jgi:hypothetical protein